MADLSLRRNMLYAGLCSLLLPLPSLAAQAPASVPPPSGKPTDTTAKTPSPAAANTPIWPAWESFRTQFMNEGGRILSGAEGTGQTYSEAQAYALFFALVANDRASFEKILAWTLLPPVPVI